MTTRTSARTSGDHLERASAAHPCPVCGKPDWCLTAPDGSTAICQRIEVGSVKRSGGAGWLHRLTDRPWTPSATKPPKKQTPPRNWLADAERDATRMTDANREWLHARLGLPPGALDAIPLLGECGANTSGPITSWPEVDAAGVVIGITDRTPGADKDEKKMRAGGKRGLTLPADWRDRPGPVFVVEGPTDAAAMTAAGLCAVGRPSKDGGGKWLAQLFADWPTDREVVIVGENDPPSPDGRLDGRDAAVRLATALAAARGRPIRWTLPPADAKDVRGWLTHPDRGETPWPERGTELAATLLAASVPVAPSKSAAPSGPPTFRVGERVSPADRQNVGTVSEVLPDGRYRVHFVGENGEANVTFGEADLRPDPPPAGGANPAGGAVLMPPYRPFPVHSLPPAVRAFVTSVAASVGCDPCFAALPALTLVGAAIGGALAVRPKNGWNEVPILWAVVVGDSGTAKSPAADPVSAVAHGIEDELDEEYTRAMAAYREAMAAAESQEDGDADHHAPTRPPPVREYFTADDVTIERLIENLRSSPRGILMLQDELANWFGSFARYKGKSGGNDVSQWLEMFDGRPVSYQRKTAAPGTPRDVRVKRAIVSVSGGIQPGILAESLRNPAYLNSGLAARLIFAMPPKHCVRWTDSEPDPEAERRFRAVVHALRELPFDPRSAAPAVGLGTTARAAFIRFHDDMAATAEGHDGGGMAAAIPKLARVALRLAMIHHCATEVDTDRDPGQGSIGETSMLAGIELAKWFETEAERVYAMLSERPEDRAARTLAEWVARKGGRATPRDLQRSSKHKYPTAAAAEAALDALVTAGAGRWEERPSPKSGGWCGRTFLLAVPPPADAGTAPAAGASVGGTAGPGGTVSSQPAPWHRHVGPQRRCRMTAKMLLQRLVAAGCPPTIDGLDVAFYAPIPPDLERYFPVLLTGVRAILMQKLWHGIRPDGHSAGPNPYASGGPLAYGSLDPAALLPRDVTYLLVCAGIDEKWDRLAPSAISDLPECFEPER